MSKKNDRSLRFYNEVLGLDRLHYGIWNSDDELSIQKLKEAQVRYEDFLIDNIPDGVKTVLDVGCGTGILTKKLMEKGFDVEGLSPDINQKKVFSKRNKNAIFHHMGYENFTLSNKYDCIIMSESAQYIKMNKIFENSMQALKENGYLMICDYFVLKNAKGKLSKSGHKQDIFNKQLDNSDFDIAFEEDITDDVLKTLDLGKDFLNRALLGLDIGTEKIRNKYKRTTKFVLWFFRNKIKKLKKESQLIDSKAFKKNKIYRFLLLKKKTD